MIFIVWALKASYRELNVGEKNPEKKRRTCYATQSAAPSFAIERNIEHDFQILMLSLECVTKWTTDVNEVMSPKILKQI